MSYLDNIRTFVRVYDLGSMSAAGRDLRISPAVTSARISQLEAHLGVRLFQRTTRNLTPTEQGRAFYDGACAVLDTVEQADTKLPIPKTTFQAECGRHNPGGLAMNAKIPRD